MEIIDNPLSASGVKLFRPKIFSDERGYFFESHNERQFAPVIGAIRFCQDNQSLSSKGVLRGLHYQLSPKAQSKLVRVVQGRIWDVAIDLRKESPTYLTWFGAELSAENQLQLFIPKGFGHGFLALSEFALVHYKVDEYYVKDFDRGIRFDDPQIAIGWPIEVEPLLSEKDQALPFLSNAETFK